jgi:hypothetical protein
MVYASHRENDPQPCFTDPSEPFMMNVNEHPANQNVASNSDEVEVSELVHAVPVPQAAAPPHSLPEQPLSANIGHNTATRI